MRIPLRRLLSRLTAIALTASVIGPASAATPAGTQLQADDDDDDLCDDDDLEIDPEHIDTEDAALALGRGLAIAMGEMRPLAATHLAATWSLSTDPLRRLSLAVALEWAFPLVGAGLVIDHLARDPDPSIRTAAARAAWIRRPSGGDSGVLERLADDPDPGVRAVVAAAR